MVRNMNIKQRRTLMLVIGCALLGGFALVPATACVGMLGLDEYTDKDQTDEPMSCVPRNDAATLLMVSGSYDSKEFRLDQSCLDTKSGSDAGSGGMGHGVYAAMIEPNCGACVQYVNFENSQLSATPAVRFNGEPYVFGSYYADTKIGPSCDAGTEITLPGQGDSVFVVRLLRERDLCIDWVATLANQTPDTSPHINALTVNSGWVFVVGGLDGAKVDSGAGGSGNDLAPAAFIWRFSVMDGQLEKLWKLGGPGTDGPGGAGAPDSLAAVNSANDVVVIDGGVAPTAVVTGGFHYDAGSLAAHCGSYCSASDVCKANLNPSTVGQKLFLWQGGDAEGCGSLDVFGSPHLDGGAIQIGYGLASSYEDDNCVFVVAGTTGMQSWSFFDDPTLPQGTGAVENQHDGFLLRSSSTTGKNCVPRVSMDTGSIDHWGARWVAPPPGAATAINRVALDNHGHLIATGFTRLADVQGEMTLHVYREGTSLLNTLTLPGKPQSGNDGALVVVKYDHDGNVIWRFAIAGIESPFAPFTNQGAPVDGQASLLRNNLVVDKEGGDVYVLVRVPFVATGIEASLPGLYNSESCALSGSGDYLLKIANDAVGDKQAQCLWASKITYH